MPTFSNVSRLLFYDYVKRLKSTNRKFNLAFFDFERETWNIFKKSYRLIRIFTEVRKNALIYSARIVKIV